MGKSSGSAPQAPDPAKLVGLQSQADKDAFNYQTAANRYNTYGPDQNTTWDKSSQFDEDAYNKALQSWQGANPQGKWVPGSPAGSLLTGNGTSGGYDTSGLYPEGINPGNGDQGWVDPSSTGTGGHWEGGTSTGELAPTRDQFTTNKWSQTTTLSPEQQRLHDLNLSSQTGQGELLDALTQRLKGTYSTPFSTAGVPGVRSDIGSAGLQNNVANLGGYESRLAGLDPKQFNQQAADAVYNQQNRYFSEDQKNNQQAMEARLAEQGFVPGTPGYDKAMGQFQDNQNQSRADMRDRATTQGYNVGNQQFGNEQGSIQAAIAAALSGANFGNASRQQTFTNTKDAAQFNNTARSQQIAELLQERQQPLNELNSLRAGTQQSLPGTPQAGSTGANLSGVDTMGAYQNQYKALLDKYNAGVNSDNADTSALVGIASALAMAFSDERLKDNIEPVGETEGGNTVYEYDMDGRRQRGVMAQELLGKGDPDHAVHRHPSGYFMVDYSKVS